MTAARKKVVGRCYVGQHHTKGDYIIMRFAHNASGGADFMYGPVVRVSATEMAQAGLGIVLSHICRPPSLNPRALLPSQEIPQREALKLKREHPLVAVYLKEGENLEIKLCPLHAGHGWRFDARPEEFRTLPLPVSNDDFMRFLAEALEIAT